MLGLCRLVFPFVEDHKFYCEHWFTTRFFQKVKAFGALLARFGVIAEADDVFHLHHTEIDQALADVSLAWAAGSPPLGGAHFPPVIAERKRMLKVLRDWSPPPALGPVPEATQRPRGAHAVGRHRRADRRRGCTRTPTRCTASPPSPASVKADRPGAAGRQRDRLAA